MATQTQILKHRTWAIAALLLIVGLVISCSTGNEEATAPSPTIEQTQVATTPVNNPTPTTETGAVDTATPSEPGPTTTATARLATPSTKGMEPSATSIQQGLPLPELVREPGRTVSEYQYNGMFMVGLNRLIHFRNAGSSGTLDVTVELVDSRLRAAYGPGSIGQDQAASSLTKQFQVTAGESYVLTVFFDISVHAESEWVPNSGQRACSFDPVTGMRNVDCVCTATNISIRVSSQPEGLEFQAPDLNETCERYVRLRDIGLAVSQAVP